MDGVKNYIKDLAKTILISFGIVLLLTNFVFRIVYIDGHSMNPTLTDGSYAVAGIINRFFGLNRFDIVTIDLPGTNDHLVKRIIAMPNETIEYINNQLFVDGVFYDEPFLGNDAITEDFKVTLRENQYFVLGDNRAHSSDSRYYGPFSDSNIKTSGLFVLIRR